MRTLLLSILVTACAHDHRVRFPSNAVDTGSIVLRFTRPVRHITVSVNGIPIAQDEHTQRITVDGIPVGQTTIMIAGDGLEKAFVVELQPGQRLVVPLAGPEGTAVGRTLIQAVAAAIFYATYVTLSSLL